MERQFALMSLEEKNSRISALLTWAEAQKIPSNSQIQEILAGLVRTAADHMLKDADQKWEYVAETASVSAGAGSFGIPHDEFIDNMLAVTPVANSDVMHVL